MKNSYNTEYNPIDSENDFDLKKEFFKYFYFWRFFVASIVFFAIIAFTFLRYTSKTYRSTAKIQILDKKNTSLELPTASELFSKSNINIENEIEVLKSYPILSQVIENKNLHTSVIAVGNIKSSLVTNYPFDISLNIPTNDILESVYELNITEKGFEITNDKDKSKKFLFNGNSTKNYEHDLPFEIFNFNRLNFIDEKNASYKIHLKPIKKVVDSFKKSIQITQAGKESDIVLLNFKSPSSNYSSIVLNELVDVFNNDGIKDRQLIHKRTIDFVNERYAFLSNELDSIEIAKQLYKVDNELVDFTANSAISLEKSFKSEENIFTIENQISITTLLINTLTNDKLELLPANMVIENEEINSLISEYNQKILERKKLAISAGSNNPSTKQMENIIRDFRSNIIFSLQNHLSQLNNIKVKLSNQFFRYNDEVSNLPEKEKILRAIERNQKIKEALYLFLLQKREEAEVSFAVTEPSIKVVEYAMPNIIPVSPKTIFVWVGALFIGVLIPFIVLYLLFSLNRKIYSKDQYDELKLPIPLICEIPEIQDQSNTTVSSSNERSPLAESFRIFYSKLKFFGVNEKKSHVIMLTSTIKGEGKTFCAVNLAYTKATLGKKVLLIGADLHNPQIHTYLNIEKNVAGLVNYLVDNKFEWEKAVVKPKSIPNCDVLIGGQIPPNPAQLLNSNNFKDLLDHAKKLYDHIIIDTPPCLLVSDTIGISHLSDLLLFVVRCNHTNIEVLDFIKDSYKKGVIKDNSMVILNGIGATNSYGYGYAYNYSYGYKYQYKYNYNYGYGYDYESDK